MKSHHKSMAVGALAGILLIIILFLVAFFVHQGSLYVGTGVENTFGLLFLVIGAVVLIVDFVKPISPRQ